MTGGALNPSRRAADWTALVTEEFDVLVVGGGVTGAGVALDAATRGLKVALVEARDLASGTSSRSSKLFHGGLRYLEMMDFRLVREALRERDLMLTTIAPHLVTPVRFLYPLKHRVWERAYVGVGLMLYEALAGRSPMPRHRHLTRTQALRNAPALKREALAGALYYFDAETDDARHTLTVARTAAAKGAIVRTSTEVVGLVVTDGRVVGARISDAENGQTGVVRARVVVGCTGVWSDHLYEMAGVASPFRVRASKGVHILVPRGRINSDSGLILRTETSVLFVIPWDEHWLIGTTDTPWDLELEHPAATLADIDYLLDRVNEVLEDPLTVGDIVGVYAGLRPLLEPPDVSTGATARISREHQVARAIPGLVTVAGGKYTTYRVMALDALDVAVADVGRPVPESVSAQVPLIGAAGLAGIRRRADCVAVRYGLPTSAVRRMIGRYGDLVEEVLAPISDDETLAEAVPGASQHLMAEIRYAVTHEGALHLDDLLTRRTRISVDTSHRGLESAPAVAALAAPLLGWSSADVDHEIASYRQRVERERESQQQLRDVDAQRARSRAPEVREFREPRKAIDPPIDQPTGS